MTDMHAVWASRFTTPNITNVAFASAFFPPTYLRVLSENGAHPDDDLTMDPQPMDLMGVDFRGPVSPHRRSRLPSIHHFGRGLLRTFLGCARHSENFWRGSPSTPRRSNSDIW